MGGTEAERGAQAHLRGVHSPRGMRVFHQLFVDQTQKDFSTLKKGSW